MDSLVDIPAVLSGASFLFTSYYWFIKARKEKPNLQFHQLSNFRSSSRRNPEKAGKKRLCLQQLDTGGVLIVNHSTRQNSVILFECFLQTEQGLIRGDWGYSEDDKPPWNIGPESTIAISPACFFDVPEEFEVTDELAFSLRFITASGKHFSHRFRNKRLVSAPTRRQHVGQLEIRTARPVVLQLTLSLCRLAQRIFNNRPHLLVLPQALQVAHHFAHGFVHA